MGGSGVVAHELVIMPPWGRRECATALSCSIVLGDLGFRPFWPGERFPEVGENDKGSRR